MKYLYYALILITIALYTYTLHQVMEIDYLAGFLFIIISAALISFGMYMVDHQYTGGAE